MFEIQIPALLGQDIEDGSTSELIRLSHDVQILACQITSTVSIDRDRAARAFVASGRGGNLSLSRQLCRSAIAPWFRLRSGTVRTAPALR